MVTQVEIARRLGLDVSSVNKILNRRAGPVFRKETVKNVFKTAKEMGYDFGRIKFAHRRRHPRRDVSLNAELYIYNKDGSLYDQGMATIRDISLGGARVSDVTLPLGSIPSEIFTVSLKPLAKPLDEIEIPGQIVRLHVNPEAAYSICFGKLDTASVQRLRKITGN